MGKTSDGVTVFTTQPKDERAAAIAKEHGIDLQQLIAALPADATVGEVMDELAKLDPVIWTMLNRRLKQLPMTFDMSKVIKQGRTTMDVLVRHRPFLIQPLRDQHKHKVYEKARQIGISELSITEVLFFLDTAGANRKWIYCVDESAEILTRRGWKHYDEVHDSDETLVLDPETHQSRWEPILTIRTFDFDGELRAVGPFHCTDEHRWPVEERRQYHSDYMRKVTTAEELNQRHRHVRHAKYQHDGQPSVLSPRLAAILGWVVTDGCQWMTGSTRGKNTVMMSVVQSERKHLAAIEDLLQNKRRNPRQQENGNTCWTVTVRREDVEALLTAGYKAKEDLPSLVTRLSLRAAQTMWNAMMDAEGCKSGPRLGSKHFAQNPGPVLEAFQIICVFLGKAANITSRGAYVVEADSRSAHMRAVYTNVAKKQYSGIVWCPQTKSGTWYMRQEGRVVFTGNTFPRDKQLQDFSNTRIAQTLDETPRMAALLGVPNQTYTKRIHDSFLILRSAWESNLGEGVDADGVTLDEKDRMKDGIDIAFRESLSSSKFGLFREVSTPTLPGRGVDASWRKSDQHIWHVKCSKCGMEQPVEYPENFIQVKDYPLGATELPRDSWVYACRKLSCRGPLDRLHGRWICSFLHVRWCAATTFHRLSVHGSAPPMSSKRRLSISFSNCGKTTCSAAPARVNRSSSPMLISTTAHRSTCRSKDDTQRLTR